MVVRPYPSAFLLILCFLASFSSVGLVCPEDSPQGLRIKARTSESKEVRVFGTAECGSAPLVEVDSAQLLVLEGECELTLGIRTRNGNLFRPVTRSLRAEPGKIQTLEVEVSMPPSVQAVFFDDGEAFETQPILGYQGDQLVVGIRGPEPEYVDPGDYEFRTLPTFFYPMTLSATLKEGEHRVLHFEIPFRAHLKVRMVSAGREIDFREKYDLWQGDERPHQIHWINGIRVEPGDYSLRLKNPLRPFEVKKIRVTQEKEQDFRVEVPAAHIRVTYERWDGREDRQARIFLRRWMGGGWGERHAEQSGRWIPLAAGRWKLEGWNHRGKVYGFEEFTAENGEDLDLVLRNQKRR